ncbi:MAG: hypothetical protein KME08_16560 [Aphanothece sp. CMT-3BRIN-NPC111]|jgi:CBS-domain-containing membrane protein|nr:hypothetical protein [Aphanothece sp. CMT-3BRIN-NPC111]
MVDSAERIESLKAGTLAALSIFLAYCITSLGNYLLLAKEFQALHGLQVTTEPTELLRIAIATLSGFLFGITYRYVIRDDRNSHLNAGAVLAFGLVRGLAQVEIGLNFPDALLYAAVLGVESILLFACARLTLDWAIGLGWVKTFNS